METETSENKKIAVIGAGHIGKAFVEGLINSNFKSENIIITCRTNKKLKDIGLAYKVNSTTDNIKAAKWADLIVIAVKPKDVNKVLSEIKKFIDGKTIISMAAGISISVLKDFLNEETQKIIRIMPNIPIATNDGVIGFFAAKNISNKEKKDTLRFLSRFGLVINLKLEKELDILTLISGCGPGIVANLIKLFSSYSRVLKMDKKTSEVIALQTFLGTTNYLIRKKITAKDLEKSVATKGGITKTILKSLEHQKFSIIFFRAMTDGYLKLKHLLK
ncbi:hypothetical protein A3F59_03655 [Candidatus Roizmanbacteria bacterium RIFCSPHIGHO2_12_FULL_38_13]|nr:MAG: hypothetical protein A3F59_03655 [Candidatus Roizmanbacteria bacterium RIFCSPHIGHO2_12_FULL_38_13]